MSDEYALVNELTMACMAHLAKQIFPDSLLLLHLTFCPCAADGSLFTMKNSYGCQSGIFAPLNIHL